MASDLPGDGATDGPLLLARANALARAGDPAGARSWLTRAARGGHWPAALQLGVWDLIGLGAAVDVQAAVASVRCAAQAGHAPAQTLYAQLLAAGVCGMPRDFQQALALLQQAASAGEPRALLQLALLLPETPRLAGPRRALCEAAARGGEAMARAFLEPSAPPQHAQAVPWNDLAALVAWPHERPLPAARTLGASPRIVSLAGLFTAQECLYITRKALPLLRPASVVGRDGRPMVDPVRSNDAAKLGLLEADVVVQSLDLRIAAALGHPADNGEGLAVLRYRVGQQYLPHCDWIDPARESTRADLDRWGQRVATCVVYLNSEFEGGSTAFPKLGLELRGAVGDAFVWDNVRPDGEVDPLSLHAGLAPTQGVKFLLSKWMRDKSQAGNIT